jgi:hypothetical protein
MKDKGGHGSEKRGGGDYAPSASSKTPVYNPKLQGGVRMFGRQPTAAESAANSQATKNFSALAAGAHSAGVQQVGTKPMLPPESSQSRDLRMFADNDADLHRQSLQPVRDNLGKKMDKGVYDPDKATKLWGYHADHAAQSYAKAGGSTGENKAPWHQQFSPAVRKEAAANWEHDEAPDIKSGSSRTYKG